MPLTKSPSKEAFVSNLKSELGAGKPRAQALAIAYDVKRRSRAFGGPPPLQNPPYFIRNEARQMAHTGPIGGIGGGRSDIHNMNVPSGAYVLPSDHLAAMGNGNSASGLAIASKMFSGTPYSAGMPKLGHGKLPAPPKMKFAKGGMPPEKEGQPVPIMAASGEFVISPEIVKQIGGGDLDRGHKILDHWVVQTRKKHIKTLKNLPGPAR